MSVPATSRPPGRPRSARADRAILDASLALFVEEGFDAMTVEGVAARSGVAKTTIYRRWDSKEDLVVAAIARMIGDVRTPDTGSLREDLVDLLTQMTILLTATVAGEVLPRMLGEVALQTPLGRAYVAGVLQPRFRELDTVLRRGVERGELPADADLELARDLVIGPMIVRRVLGRMPRRRVREAAERLTDTVLAALRAPG
ncbi:MAG TPA: TetR/AcrR family transcriptional regulator [Actinomycetota bacterium]